MPEKTKIYELVIFTPEVIKEAIDTLIITMPRNKRKLADSVLRITLPSGETWKHSTEDEFFADYRKGFRNVWFRKAYGSWDGLLELTSYRGEDSEVQVKMPTRTDVEKVFNIFEANVEECRLPRQPVDEKSKIKTDWIIEAINKVEGRCQIAGRKLRLALTKLDSGEAEEWQNATMLIRDAWIELTQWLCQVNNIDTSDIATEAVVDRLKKLGIKETDEKLFDLARASFNLYATHHKRTIDNDTAVACVISTIVSMQTVIREVFNARS